ncbi:MAG: hypothetical protein JNL74_21710 [Fibrobacteres bacterium]|nr:hypothetical protein [Fibrobacterota bacterium]
MNRFHNPLLLGFTPADHSQIQHYLNALDTADLELPVILSMSLAAGSSFQEFRQKLTLKYSITSLETVLDFLPNSKLNGVKVSLHRRNSTTDDEFEVHFRHTTSPKEPSREFKVVVTNKTLTNSLLPAHHLPERIDYFNHLQSLTPLTALGDLFDVNVGVNMIVAANRKEGSSYKKGRLVTSGIISQSRFLRETFSDNEINIPITKKLLQLKKLDILISTQPNNNPEQNYAMVVDSTLTNAYHNHVLLRLSLKQGVDPRMAKVFFALWANEKYRLLYPFVPGSLPMIHISHLIDLPIPYLGDDRMLKIVDSNVSKLIALDDQRLATYQDLKELF